KPAFTATVYVNDRQVLSKNFAPADALSPGDTPVRLSDNELAPGENRVRVEMNGTGRLYWSARAEYYSTEPKLTRTGTVSLNLLRDYFKLTPVKEGEKIVYRLDTLHDDVASGYRVAVRLTACCGNWRYLLLYDRFSDGSALV